MAGAGGGTRYGPSMRAACALLGSLAAAAAKGTPKPGTGPHVLEDDDPSTNDEFDDGAVDTFEVTAPAALEVAAVPGLVAQARDGVVAGRGK